MANRTKPVRYWPEASKELLLQAAFLAGNEGFLAWKSWKSQINMDDHPDFGSFRLLPALYRNLPTLGVTDPDQDKLKGISRRNWYKNQQFFKSILNPLQIFQSAGIKIMLLCGPALALRYYSDYALNGGVSLAVLVQPLQAKIAINQLMMAGWQPEARLPQELLEAYLEVGASHIFKDGLGRRLQLHWRVLPECPSFEADNLFWAEAQTVTLSNIPVYTLNPADQILHICVQDSCTSKTTLFLRAIDVMMVISASEEQIDWARMVKLAQQYRLIWPLRSVFEYLHKRQVRPLPPKIWQLLQAQSVPPQERWEYRLKRGSFVIPSRLGRLWFNYTRRSDHRGLAGFPTYLQKFWRLKNLGQVPGQALSAARSRLRQSG